MVQGLLDFMEKLIGARHSHETPKSQVFPGTCPKVFSDLNRAVMWSTGRSPKVEKRHHLILLFPQGPSLPVPIMLIRMID